MNNERNELAREIFIADNSDSPDPAAEWEIRRAQYAYEIADGLLTAGYRKPRTITTAEELDALPDRAVILSRFKDGIPMHSTMRGDSEFAGNVLPATILWEPTS